MIPQFLFRHHSKISHLHGQIEDITKATLESHGVASLIKVDVEVKPTPNLYIKGFCNTYRKDAVQITVKLTKSFKNNELIFVLLHELAHAIQHDRGGNNIFPESPCDEMDAEIFATVEAAKYLNISINQALVDFRPYMWYKFTQYIDTVGLDQHLKLAA